MLKIFALNEPEEDVDSEKDVLIAREAQEAIVLSEYVRAINLKTSGKSQASLKLLSDLLETKLLNEFHSDEASRNLWQIRYNCHKLVAAIHEEKMFYSFALEHYEKAMQIDDSDVFTMLRCGILALKVCNFELSQKAFQNCLKKNPYHWDAVDGLLQTFYRNKNVMGAYHCAVDLINQDSDNYLALETLYKIKYLCGDLLPFYESVCGRFPMHTSSICLRNTNVVEPFPFKKETSKSRSDRIEASANLKDLDMKAKDWLSLATYIQKLHTILNDFQCNTFLRLNKCDIFLESEKYSAHNEVISRKDLETESILDQNSKSEQESEVKTATITIFEDMDPDGPGKTAGQPTLVENEETERTDEIRAKSKRRCSDLHFLEQWGWHKRRRYSSRKKTNERMEIDMSLNGSLKKIFTKFNYEGFTEDWPFPKHDNITEDYLNDEIELKVCDACKESVSLENIELDFNKFVKDLQEKPFDLIEISRKWLKYLSCHWNNSLPLELKSIYKNIYKIYSESCDNSYGAILDYEICTFYLELWSSELSYGPDVQKWKSTLDSLMVNSGSAFIRMGSQSVLYKLRLINLEYFYWTLMDSTDNRVICLQQIESFFEESGRLMLHIPHMNVCMNKSRISSICRKLQRQMLLNEIPKLYEQSNWRELTEIISTNLMNNRNISRTEKWSKDMKIQVELLLLSQWNMNCFTECLIWSEMCFHLAVTQYLGTSKNSTIQKQLVETINFIYTYIESLISRESFEVVTHLGNKAYRLVQNIIRLLSYQFDDPVDKANSSLPDLDTGKPWIILHQIMLREENTTIEKNRIQENEDEDIMPNSFLILFTAHESLGKRHWCTKDNGRLLLYILKVISPNLRAPLYDGCREVVYEYMEQVTHCLFGYPQKKARLRHLEDHDAQSIDLTWESAIQLFDLYRPEPLPELNSYKHESISSDMEQLLLKMLKLLPQNNDLKNNVNYILQFICGDVGDPPEDISTVKLPFKINTIYYLLGDYYFKNHDFSKAIKYYTLDLSYNPSRFDSWAGLALSKASKIETKINMLTSDSIFDLLRESDDTNRCFERCIALNRLHTLIWIEYGSFAYMLHSYCSRHLKSSYLKALQDREITNIKQRKEDMLKIAYNCFTVAANLQNSGAAGNDDYNDERWLCQYMLGKISEKRRDSAKIFLNYYLMAANCLYESNATYPIKVNHSNPTTLSVEALEVFYRTNAAIIKVLERKKEISCEERNLFANVLYSLSRSPFAYNKAKIDGNSFSTIKGKGSERFQPSREKVEENVKPFQIGIQNVESDNPSKRCIGVEQGSSWKVSHEKGRLVASVASSSGRSESTTSDSESDTEGNKTVKEEKQMNVEDPTTSLRTLKNMFKAVINNFEECVTRFPEHYKSIYRLVHHFISYDVERCEQLLLGQYKTSMGNIINGVFYDRKAINLFNGIWRIPSSEIDRPGSFSAHLVNCVSILIKFLRKTNNYKELFDIALQLYKTPESDRRYIKDTDRTLLYEQSISYCAQTIREILNRNKDYNSCETTLNLLLDVYKIHKKCVKYMNQNESRFTELLIEVYKYFLRDRIQLLPPNANYFDMAIKLCVQEMSMRKSINKPPHFTISNTESTMASKTSQAASISPLAKANNNLTKNILCTPENISQYNKCTARILPDHIPLFVSKTNVLCGDLSISPMLSQVLSRAEIKDTSNTCKLPEKKASFSFLHHQSEANDETTINLITNVKLPGQDDNSNYSMMSQIRNSESDNVSSAVNSVESNHCHFNVLSQYSQLINQSQLEKNAIEVNKNTTTKSLQQLLVERQKLSQLNEAMAIATDSENHNQTSNQVQISNTGDVIVLD